MDLDHIAKHEMLRGHFSKGGSMADLDLTQHSYDDIYFAKIKNALGDGDSLWGILKAVGIFLTMPLDKSRYNAIRENWLDRRIEEPRRRKEIVERYGELPRASCYAG